MLVLQDVPLSVIIPSDNRYSTILKSRYLSSFDFEDLRIWFSGIISLFYCVLVQVLILKSRGFGVLVLLYYFIVIRRHE